MWRTVAINERGLRIGQDHHLARLADSDVELMRTLHEDGMTYNELADKFDVSPGTVGRICRYERRAQTVAGHRDVHIPPQ